MDNDKKELPDIEGLIVNLDLDDREVEVLLIQLITSYVMAANDGEEGMQRYSRVINAIGSAIAHGTTVSRLNKDGDNGEESLHDEDNWVTSPKDLVTYLLESDTLLDREFLADSYKEYCVVRALNEAFEMPDAEK